MKTLENVHSLYIADSVGRAVHGRLSIFFLHF
jgi:hypothetical protein